MDLRNTCAMAAPSCREEQVEYRSCYKIDAVCGKTEYVKEAQPRNKRMHMQRLCRARLLLLLEGSLSRFVKIFSLCLAQPLGCGLPLAFVLDPGVCRPLARFFGGMTRARDRGCYQATA